MLNKFFTKPLELKVAGQTLKFSSVADFEFSVAGRVAVPSKKITEMVKFSPDQLKKEAKTIKEIEKRFVNILSQSIEDSASINRALRELDPLIFSQDHGWREIIGALNEGDDSYNPFRRIALVKYMQYLSARQEIIKYLYSEKKKYLEETPGLAETATDSTKFKDTLILENTIFEPVAGDKKAGDFERLPKGEVVTLTLSPGTEVDVMLSKHHCKLLADGKVRFIDQEGRRYDLKEGRNIIGRDTVSTVLIDPALRDVSRLHLVIENLDNKTVQLTDMSSHGTYIPAKYLQNRSNW
ncbi:MAG: FHA domain-containing protein [Gammaproteobacteria bacterium]|nr:FHA domain-containing protein [Gammaproteobacteria bacterium]